jgi:hypothetical protein
MVNNYTEHDLHVAQEIGGLKTLMQATHDKLGNYIDAHGNEHQTMWGRVDAVKKQVNGNTKMIYKGMGVAAFIGALFGAIGHWLKIKFTG